MHKNFFEADYIKKLSKDEIFSELIIKLSDYEADPERISCPENITFGYISDHKALKEAIEKVETDWLQYFEEDAKVFGAFDNEKIVSFCVLDDMGTHFGLHISGPGCVGTIPEYRGHQIGLKMVLLATKLLKDEGYDLSYIHYTAIDHWYEKLGYETVVKWNGDGIVWAKEE